MKNIRIISFAAFLLLYALGVVIGGNSQVKSIKQEEMYQYLESSVADYNTSAVKSMKGVAADNLKLFLLGALGGLIKPGLVLFALLAALKGYSAGFSITCVLRLYGIKGLVFCGANLISALVIVPALAAYCGGMCQNLFCYSKEKAVFIKRYLIFAALLFVVLCVDSVARGFLSSVFMKIAVNLVKTT